MDRRAFFAYAEKGIWFLYLNTALPTLCESKGVAHPWR